MKGGFRKFVLIYFVLFSNHIDCSDKHPSCDELEKSGHCVSKPLYMGGLCPKACSFCDGDCSNKVDNQICNMLFRHGNCDSKSDYMMENCRFTCGCNTGEYVGMLVYMVVVLI